ncbi:MAG: hypothetical protein ACR2GH_03375 [Pseudonocardia sp.]
MTADQVLAAAAALREFSLEEIAVFCDEQPPVIADILASAGPAVERVEQDHEGEPGEQHWRVADLAGLRSALRRGTTRDPAGPAPDETAGARLEYAEETLVGCEAEPSAERRRVMVATAVNHLRQVLATTLPSRPPWWMVELAGDELEHELRQHPDPAIAARLQLNVAVARLAEGNVAGIPIPTSELIERATHFHGTIPLLGGQRLQGLARGFIDLATAQLAPTAAPAIDRLVVAVARRRLRECDLDAAMQRLGPLLRTLDTVPDRTPCQGLYLPLGQLPDGSDRAIVYADLLQILPPDLRWQPQSEPLPGALVEIVAELAASDYLSRCARTLEADLAHSPFYSDSALIGQVAHVLQELAQRDAGMHAQCDTTRSKLLALAKATVWPAPAPRS